MKKENEHSEKQLLHVCTHWARKEKKRYIFTQSIKKKEEIRQQSECMPSQQKINNNKQIIGHHN